MAKRGDKSLDGVVPPPSKSSQAARHPALDQLVTPKQIAQFLKVSPRTVARLVRERKLPKVIVGGRIRFIPNDVLEYLRRR